MDDRTVFRMELSSTWITVAAIVIALIAYVLGRNPVLWGIFGYLNVLLALIFLFIRHRVRPKEKPEWLTESVHRMKLKMWARDLKPEDFDEPPRGDEA